MKGSTKSKVRFAVCIKNKGYEAQQGCLVTTVRDPAAMRREVREGSRRDPAVYGNFGSI
jgi:hypothetical protein